MKIRSIKEGNLVLTPSGLLTFLSQIEELDTKGNLAITEDNDALEIAIGDSVYVLECTEESDVEVDPEVIETIQDINEEGYETFEEEIGELDSEPVEGGIIKELAKTLAVGALVRLTKNAITNS